MNIHEFYVGQAFDAYDYFGAHITEEGVVFRVYAPQAKKIQVIGDFNGWDEEADEMIQDGESGIFSVTVPKAREGDLYKYRICQQDGRVTERFDPYGFGSELRPKTAARIVRIEDYKFHDGDWMKKRSKNYNSPVNIYEIHAGSWKKNPDDENGWYRYDELAELLISYLKEMNYTHVEFLPLLEHPADCSWGYQVSGYFCPTSRYGTAKDLMRMVDLFHQAGIGVIMDFVPVHFVVNDYALSMFDGTALYEYPAADVGYSEWGTCNFNYYRGEVCSLLQSSADFWLTAFHFDGIRMDAISNAIYWQGAADRGVNEGALQFVKNMNRGLQRRHPSAMLIAEDSTNFPKVTVPVEYDGLGFDYKWDMGWMNDTLDYFKINPYDRKWHYNKLTFSMMYFKNEHYMMTLSHDEVVHGKATIIQKMWGEYGYKFQQVKTLYTYMYTHPGKKLNFMGNEIGHFREWDEEKECDWFLLKYPKHDSLKRFMRKLHHLYLTEPALYDGEYNPASFRWLEADASEECVYVYERICKEDRIIVVINASLEEYHAFPFGYDHNAQITELLSGEREEFGGYFSGGEKVIKAEKPGCKWWKYKFKVHIPALGAVIYKVKYLEEPEEIPEKKNAGMKKGQRKLRNENRRKA